MPLDIQVLGCHQEYPGLLAVSPGVACHLPKSNILFANYFIRFLKSFLTYKVIPKSKSIVRYCRFVVRF